MVKSRFFGSLVIKNLQQFFKFFDLYGQNVNLFINKKPKFYTPFSGLISMAVISIILLTFTGYISSWINNEKITPIPSSNSYSSLELLAQNQIYEYEFNYENYAIYWVISATLPDGTYFGTNDLKNYYTYHIIKGDEYFNREELISEPCKTDQMDIFLGMDEATIDQDRGKISTNRICIKDQFKLGIFPNTTIQYVVTSDLSFYMFPCVNSTSNNNSCASQEAIDEVIQYTLVQTSIPTTMYDFKNSKKLKKNVYNYHLTRLDKTLEKNYMNSLTMLCAYNNGVCISVLFDWHIEQ